jgi:hypothetical protein
MAQAQSEIGLQVICIEAASLKEDWDKSDGEEH